MLVANVTGIAPTKHRSVVDKLDIKTYPIKSLPPQASTTKPIKPENIVCSH